MQSIINSLYGRLVIALAVSFIAVGLFITWVMYKTTQNYQEEVAQKLHWNLAEHIVHDHTLFDNNNIDPVALKGAFHNMMILGPSFEFYLISPTGKLLSHAADPSAIKRQSIPVETIKQFLADDALPPLHGPNPRSASENKIFSVAPVYEDDNLQAYLYIIIGGDIYDNVVELVQDSHILGLGTWLLISGVAFGLICTLLIIALLTRPLKMLHQDIQRFRLQGFDYDQLQLTGWRDNSNNDIHMIGSSFNALIIKLKTQYEKVKSIDELRKELLSHVSHDLRTPLASLQGYLETWLLKHESLDANTSQLFIKTAYRNAEKVNKLVEQLFELAHLENDKVKTEIEPVPIAELAQDVLQKFSLDAQKKGVQLRIIPQSPSLIVQADVEKIDRVFTNLIDNALRHCDSGDRIQVRMQKKAEKVEITVVDTGKGIPEKDLPYIFDAHYKAANSVRGNSAHGGLGLAITKRLLALHNSAIDVLSIENKGTQFRFQLSVGSYSV